MNGVVFIKLNTRREDGRTRTLSTPLPAPTHYFDSSEAKADIAASKSCIRLLVWIPYILPKRICRNMIDRPEIMPERRYFLPLLLKNIGLASFHRKIQNKRAMQMLYRILNFSKFWKLKRQFLYHFPILPIFKEIYVKGLDRWICAQKLRMIAGKIKKY